MNERITPRNDFKNLISHILLVIVIAFCIFFFFSSSSVSPIYPAPHCYPLVGGWEVETADRHYTFSGSPGCVDAAPEDKVVARRNLPLIFPSNTAIYFRSSQQTVTVKVDGTVLYQYDTSDSRPFGKASASNWNFIPLPKDAKGAALEIVLSSPYKDYSGYFSTVYFGSYQNLIDNLFSQNFLGYFICLFLFISGILLVICSYLIRKFSDQTLAFRYLGYFSILISFWMSLESKLPPFFISNPTAGLFISLLGLMLSPLPYLLFLKFYISEKYYNFIDFLFAAFSLNFVICVILQLLGVADLIEMLLPICVLTIAVIILLCVHFADSCRNKNTHSLLLSAAGLLFLSFSICSEITLYYTQQFEHTKIFFQLGLFIHVLILCIYVLRNMLQQKRTDSYLSEKLLKQQINMMISHIQPHFVFNSLGAIQSFIKKEPETAYQMMFDFSKYLRSSMMAWEGQVPIPFATEVEYIKAFTDIQTIRFRNSFHILYDIQSDSFLVPLLSIRALVENAVNHGVRKANNSGTVLIKSYELPDMYVIEVIDDGAGFDVKEFHYGDNTSCSLHRIHDILKKEFHAGLRVESVVGKGTTITVKFYKLSK